MKENNKRSLFTFQELIRNVNFEQATKIAAIKSKEK